jgi:Arc/MetJ family transcription regulator
MRTTLDLDEKLLERVIEATGEKSKSKALNKVMEEYLRHRAVDELLAMAGKIELDDSWEVWRRTDLGKLREFQVDEQV